MDEPVTLPQRVWPMDKEVARRNTINRGTWWCAFCILAIAFFCVYAEESVGGDHQKSVPKLHRYVTGTVSKISDGAVSLQIGKETQLNFSIKDIQLEKIEGLKVGDRITLELDEVDRIIDINRAADRGIKGYGEGLILITGEVVSFEPQTKTVNLKLEDEFLRSYRMSDGAAAKMKDIKKGTRIIMGINKVSGRVEDFKEY